MCLGIPMEIIDLADPMTARCRGRQGERLINLWLVGQQPVGTWLLVHLDSAREVISPERAAQVDDALNALEAAMSGGDLTGLFADLEGRTPQLPDHLRPLEKAR